MVELLPQFKFVVVWEFAAVLDQVERFVDFGQSKLHARVQYIADIPIVSVPERTDVLFAVHEDDIWPFFYRRPLFAMDWLERVLDRNPQLYPEHLNQYRRY